jgi:type II secretory pathway pseudopilin PulG
MNKTIHLGRSGRTPWVPARPERAFTFTELLVVLATLAVLAMVLLPALAGTVQKSGRAQCANNLRQIGIASMIYANEYSTWLPIWYLDESHPLNRLNVVHYTRYKFMGNYSYWKVPTNASPSDGTFENLGHLYQVGLDGDRKFFYCPDQQGTLLGANAYSPLLTTGSDGIVRSSYDFNPRAVLTVGYYYRSYQKTSQLEPHKLFAVDDLSVGVGPAAFAHFREHGWNVLFTDDSAQFSRSDQAYQLLPTLLVGGGNLYYPQANQVFDLLEQDH